MENKAPKKKEKSKAKKVVSIVLTVLLVVILATVGGLLIHIKTADDPSVFGYGIYTVVSGSMTPTIMIGDVLLVKKVEDPASLKKGDVITFNGRGKLEGKVVTHRIVSEGVVDGQIVTAGDANYGLTDDPITFDDVIGRVVKKSGLLRLVHNAFTSKVGFALIVFIPLLILLIVQVVNFVRACKMDKDGNVKGEEAPEVSKEEQDRRLIEEYLKRQKRLRDAEKKKKDK